MNNDKWWHEGNYVWMIDWKRNTVKRHKVCTFRGKWRSWTIPRPELQAGVGTDKTWFSRSSEPTMDVYRTEMDAFTVLASHLEERSAETQVHIDRAVYDLNRATERKAKLDDATKSVREQMRKAQSEAGGDA